MSVEERCETVLKKVTELEKVALSLQKEETLERFSCKRSIKQNNMQAAIPKAKRCVELRKQSQAYFSLCQRLRIFIEQIELAEDRKDKKSRELLYTFNLVVDGLQLMNIDLVELYLESFEKSFNEKIKDRLEEVKILSYIDALRNVSPAEIDGFIQEMRIEAKEDTKAFMFKKNPLGKDIVM